MFTESLRLIDFNREFTFCICKNEALNIYTYIFHLVSDNSN